MKNNIIGMFIGIILVQGIPWRPPIVNEPGQNEYVIDKTIELSILGETSAKIIVPSPDTTRQLIEVKVIIDAYMEEKIILSRSSFFIPKDDETLEYEIFAWNAIAISFLDELEIKRLWSWTAINRKRIIDKYEVNIGDSLNGIQHAPQWENSDTGLYKTYRGDDLSKFDNPFSISIKITGKSVVAEQPRSIDVKRELNNKTNIDVQVIYSYIKE